MQKETKTLGNSDLKITAIGIGAWAIGGGGWQWAWGSQDDAHSVAAIHKALDAGINWIDTAAAYGLGHSEEVVARALGDRREKPYVFTKCALVGDANGQVSGNLKRESIRRECENSLRRLKVDAIDLYQIHWPIPDADLEEGWTAMAELKAEGKVRWIGVSNFDARQMERARRIAPITSLQPPYSLIRRGVEGAILPYSGRNHIGVIVYSPMQSGLLSGAMTRERIARMPPDDWRKRDAEFQEPLLSRNLALADLLAEIGKRHGRTAGEAAIAWTLRRPEVTGAIVGMRDPKQVDGVIHALSFRLSSAEIGEIETAAANPKERQASIA